MHTYIQCMYACGFAYHKNLYIRVLHTYMHTYIHSCITYLEPRYWTCPNITSGIHKVQWIHMQSRILVDQLVCMAYERFNKDACKYRHIFTNAQMHMYMTSVSVYIYIYIYNLTYGIGACTHAWQVTPFSTQHILNTFIHARLALRCSHWYVSVRVWLLSAYTIQDARTSATKSHIHACIHTCVLAHSVYSLAEPEAPTPDRLLTYLHLYNICKGKNKMHSECTHN